MITLGIDPGTALLGYGVVAGHDAIRMVEYGAIETRPEDSPPRRLEIIYDALIDIIDEYQPDVVAIEQLFFARNTTTALAVGQARGVAMLAASKSNLDVFEYKPAEIKLAIAGHGGADKRQIQEMVRTILGLSELPRPDDAADALAVGICHAFTAAFRQATAEASS